MPLFTELQKRVKNKYRTVSILKLCSFVRSNMAEHYCLYDHRKKQINAIEQFFFINLRLTRMRFIGTVMIATKEHI